MNGYDQSFLQWFSRHGCRIHRFINTIEIWTNGDARPVHQVTNGMIDRLETAGAIERVFPAGSNIHSEWWAVK